MPAGQYPCHSPPKTREVIRVARFSPDQAYKRAGVGLTDVVRAEARQADLFFGPDVKKEASMAVIDQINAKFGRGTVGVGTVRWRIGRVRGQSGSPRDQWRPTLKSLSPAYTTKQSDLLRVR